MVQEREDLVNRIILSAYYGAEAGASYSGHLKLCIIRILPAVGCHVPFTDSFPTIFLPFGFNREGITLKYEKLLKAEDVTLPEQRKKEWKCHSFCCIRREKPRLEAILSKVDAEIMKFILSEAEYIRVNDLKKRKVTLSYFPAELVEKFCQSPVYYISQIRLKVLRAEVEQRHLFPERLPLPPGLARKYRLG